MSHRTHEGLEGSVARRPADATLPLGIGELDDRGRHVRRLHLRGVVGDRASSTGHADPDPIRRTETWFDRSGHRVRQSLKSLLLGKCAECTGILGDEDIRRGGITFFKKKCGHARGRPVLDLDRISRRGGVLRESGTDQGFLASAVDDQLDGILGILFGLGQSD